MGSGERNRDDLWDSEGSENVPVTGGYGWESGEGNHDSWGSGWTDIIVNVRAVGDGQWVVVVREGQWGSFDHVENSIEEYERIVLLVHCSLQLCKSRMSKSFFSSLQLSYARSSISAPKVAPTF